MRGHSKNEDSGKQNKVERKKNDRNAIIVKIKYYEK